MSHRGIIPIIHIKEPRIIDLSIEDLMEGFGAKHEDEFTYTTRYTVEDAGQRELIRQDLLRRVETGEMDKEQVAALLKLLDETGWDCSFLVDTF